MNTPTTPKRSTNALSFGQSVTLVAEREVMSKLQSKSFLISTAILFLIALAGVIFSGFAATQVSATPVAVTSDAMSLVTDQPGLKVTEVADRAAAEAAVADGSVDAAVTVNADSPTGVELIGNVEVPSELQSAFTLSSTVTLLDPDTTNPMLRYIVAIGFGILFLMAASTFGGTIASSVVEEKQSRIVEILIAAIPTRALLAGKVLGNTILAMGQVIGLVAIVVIGMSVTGQGALLGLLGAPMVWFAVFFLFGFILLASLFAAAASMVSRVEDVASTTFPITMIVMLPYFLVIMFNDNPLVMTIMSYVPFSAPVGMPMRLFLGEAQWWEPLVSLVILIASCAVAILLASKIYDNSLLRMGSRVSLKEALAR